MVDPAALTLLALLAVAVAGVLWTLITRRRRQVEKESEPHRDAKPRFETTMGELRDMREALRPAERLSAARTRRPATRSADTRLGTAD